MLRTLRALLIADPLVVVATVVMGTISLVTSLFDASGHAQHAVARLWARMLLFFTGVKVTVQGLEKLAPEQGYVFAANHLSYMDTPVVIANIPVQFRFLAKKSLFKVPFIGYHLKRAGHIPVHRGDARASLRTMTESARMIRERGISVLVFPEGGRAPEEMRDFKDGAAYIAIKAGAPAVPVGLIGTRQVLPMDSLLVRGGSVRLVIGDPIPTAGLSVRDHAELTCRLQDRVAAMTEAAY